jgi:predicted DNA-binding ribbon-helix-helix protein
MCNIFAGIPQAMYAGETRSVRLGGHATSVRLEAAYWEALERLAQSEGMSLGRFLSELYAEALDLHGDVRNFTSLLRCVCLLHLEKTLRSGAGLFEAA